MNRVTTIAVLVLHNGKLTKSIDVIIVWNLVTICFIAWDVIYKCKQITEAWSYAPKAQVSLTSHPKGNNSSPVSQQAKMIKNNFQQSRTGNSTVHSAMNSRVFYAYPASSIKIWLKLNKLYSKESNVGFSGTQGQVTPTCRPSVSQISNSSET